jgi:hypothetical protein
MVLIIVLSVLAVLAILGISLLTLNALDKKVADNHLHEVQARLTAKAGVEDALARLRDGSILRTAFDPSNEWQYYGNDAGGNNPAMRSAPLAWAPRPSFAKKGKDGSLRTMKVYRDDSKSVVDIGYTDTAPGKYHEQSNVYSLEVRDLSACIFLNDGVQLYGGNNSSVSQNLKRILNVLGAHPQVAVPNLGDAVLTNRPQRGYASWDDFKATLKGKAGLNEMQFRRLERYVTAVAWVDKNVVNPVPLSQGVLSHYKIKYERGPDEDSMVFRRGPGRNFEARDRSKDERLGWMPDFGGITGPGGLTTKVYGQDELNPTYVEVTHRAPVNVNTAEEPVLAALLADLKGFFLLERRNGAPIQGNPPTFVYSNSQWYDETKSQGIWKDPSALGADRKAVKDRSFTLSTGYFTWENMGHTYDNQKWNAKTEVTETHPWWEVDGGVTGSTHTSTQDFEDRDELGELWVTPAFAAPQAAGTVAGGVSSSSIAAEIIQCRTRQGAYASAPYGGPFKSWAQFYAFCDNLVTVRKDGTPGAGILRDERFSRPEERRQAEQAMADLLKANFNPNFTPNELNPDHNLYLMIDKTDLVVNSTEFCFLPTGLFSITSVGRVVRPREWGNSTTAQARSAGVQEVVAQARIQAVVRSHDIYRETSQRHFYLGSATNAANASDTNNAQTVETGPESDNGPLVYMEHLGLDGPSMRLTPELDGYRGDSTEKGEINTGWGYEASGWLQLPTRGGWTNVKRRGAIEKVESLGTELLALDIKSGISAKPSMRACFRLSDSLDYSASADPNMIKDRTKDFLINVASNVLKAGGDAAFVTEYIYNPATCSGQYVQRKLSGEGAVIEAAADFPDPGEENTNVNNAARLGPYDPSDATRYRLCRSFRLPLSVTGTAPGVGNMTVTAPPGAGATQDLPRFRKAAPSDLRMDGYYSERHSGLAYWIDDAHFATDKGSFRTANGTATFWFKPGFDPSVSGKVRSIASVSRVHRQNFHYRNPSPFTLYFMPAHFAGTGTSDPKYPVTAPFDFKNPKDSPIAALTGNDGPSGFPRSSLVFSAAWSMFDGIGWDGEDVEKDVDGVGKIRFNSPYGRDIDKYYVTETMNTGANDKAETDADGLRAHRWSHITMSWNFLGATIGGHQGGNFAIRVLVNGAPRDGDRELSAGTNPNAWGWHATSVMKDRVARFSRQSFLDHGEQHHPGLGDVRWRNFPGCDMEDASEFYMVNTLRLGEVSTHGFVPESFPRNFSSDGTYDELYVWTSGKPVDSQNGVTNPANLGGKKFLQGRYHVPSNDDEDARWTSPELILKAPLGNRELAAGKGSTVTAPGISADRPSGAGLSTTTATANRAKLLGVSWTWFAEKYGTETVGRTIGGGRELVPIMVDYMEPASPHDLRQEKSCARIYVVVEGLRYPLNDPEGLSNDAFSSLQDSQGYAVGLGESEKFQYQVKFKIEGSNPDTVLLSTPVLDDITFYFQTTGSQFLQYVQTSTVD